jgi:hypothetical protein
VLVNPWKTLISKNAADVCAADLSWYMCLRYTYLDHDMKKLRFYDYVVYLFWLLEQ